MKIILNENETYEIDLPNEISLAELPIITSRFVMLEKSFSRINPNLELNLPDLIKPKITSKNYVPILGDSKARKHFLNRKKIWILLRKDRTACLKVLELYFHKTAEEVKAKFQNHTILSLLDRADFHNSTLREIRKGHNISPSELGLIQFPDARIRRFQSTKLNYELQHQDYEIEQEVEEVEEVEEENDIEEKENE